MDTEAVLLEVKSLLNKYFLDSVFEFRVEEGRVVLYIRHVYYDIWTKLGNHGVYKQNENGDFKLVDRRNINNYLEETCQ